MSIQSNGSINGLNPLIYTGSAPNMYIMDRAPLSSDFSEYNLGCWWLVPETANRAAELWILVSKQFGLATWKRMYLNPIEQNDLITVELFENPGSNSWTPASNMRQCYVEIIAGGGSGASGISSIPMQPGMASGGGGAYCAKLFSRSEIGNSIEYTLGAGGLAVRVPGQYDGVDGQDSTFGNPALLHVGKGTGAIRTSIFAPSNLGGNGGIGVGGDIIYNGYDAVTGDTTGGQAPFPVGYSAISGGSFYGARIFFYGEGNPDIGDDGFAGGGGGSAAQPYSGAQLYGGNGGNGLMVITSYLN